MPTNTTTPVTVNELQSRYDVAPPPAVNLPASMAFQVPAGMVWQWTSSEPVAQATGRQLALSDDAEEVREGARLPQECRMTLQIGTDARTSTMHRTLVLGLADGTLDQFVSIKAMKDTWRPARNGMGLTAFNVPAGRIIMHADEEAFRLLHIHPVRVIFEGRPLLLYAVSSMTVGVRPMLAFGAPTPPASITGEARTVMEATPGAVAALGLFVSRLCTLYRNEPHLFPTTCRPGALSGLMHDGVDVQRVVVAPGVRSALPEDHFNYSQRRQAWCFEAPGVLCLGDLMERLLRVAGRSTWTNGTRLRYGNIFGAVQPGATPAVPLNPPVVGDVAAEPIQFMGRRRLLDL